MGVKRRTSPRRHTSASPARKSNMQYALLIHEPASEFAKRNGPDAGRYWAGWMAYSQLLRESGVMTGGAGLEPPTVSTTLRMNGASRLVQDGPVADSKEQLGGFYLIDVPTLDDALAWAAKCPTFPAGAVEIRPMLPPPPSA